MGIAKLYSQSGGNGFKPNGIIKDYYVYAGEKVEKGDFVELLTGSNGDETETQVRKATTSDICGVAKTGGEGGDETGHKDIVSVYTHYKVDNLITNGDFSDGMNGWNVDSKTCSSFVVDNIAQIINKTSSSGSGIYMNLNKNLISGHIHYLSVDAKATSNIINSESSAVYAVLQNGGKNSYIGEYLTLDGEWHKLSSLYTAKESSGTDAFHLVMYMASVDSVSFWDNAKVYDLTEMFGAGNEPSQEWCDANL